MKATAASIVLALAIASGPAPAQQAIWQQKMEESRRAEARGEAEIFSIGTGSPWTPGTYVYNNSPGPFCYAYAIPGELIAERNRSGVLRSKDGRSVAGVTFLPPQRLEGVEGATLVERARNYSVRQRERAFRQPLANVELVPPECYMADLERLNKFMCRER